MSAAPAELFSISKSENKNIVKYEIAFSDSDSVTPVGIKSYWIMNERGGEIEDLSWIEKKMAYGHRVDRIDGEKVHFSLVSVPKISFTAQKKGDKYVAIANIDDQPILIEGIFIEVKTVILIKPTIRSITISGSNPETGEKIQKIINP